MLAPADLVRRGPGLTPLREAAWRDVTAALPASWAADVAVNWGWDLDWETEQWQRAAAEGRSLVSVRIEPAAVLLGPLWVPDTPSGCAACAELRRRTVLDHPLVADLTRSCTGTGGAEPLLPELTLAVLQHLATAPLAPGELYLAGTPTGRHRVRRSARCPVCREADLDTTAVDPPAPRSLQARRTDPADPSRGAAAVAWLDHHALRAGLVDELFGPVRGLVREQEAPMAMSMAVLPDAPALGHGRSVTFADAEPTGVFEAYERLAGFPFDIGLVTGRSHAEVAGLAVDVPGLGGYTAEQLSHPSCRVQPWTRDTPLDWAWGHDLVTGQPRLVPAEVAFYQYDYAFRRDRRAARAAGALAQRRFFQESSSGCSVGSSFEEAALHALLELAERDAFQLAWFGARPLPKIDRATITDPMSRALLELVEARGFEVHLLVATADIDLPVVWVLAVSRSGGFPASFSSAGADPDPRAAVRGALREVAQLATMTLDWTHQDLAPMVADPWRVVDLEDHVKVNTAPEVLHRATGVLGGPVVGLRQAFPGWPDRLQTSARGDLARALQLVTGLFAAAGLTELVAVDQSSREHRDAGLAAVRAVVPGVLPMCFGQAQQRLSGLPRLAAAVAGGPNDGRAVPYDPHPFP